MTLTATAPRPTPTTATTRTATTEPALTAPSPKPAPERNHRATTARKKAPNRQHLRAVERRHYVRDGASHRFASFIDWATERDLGAYVDRSALHLLLDAEADFETWPPDCWTEHGLWQFLWSEVSTACVLEGRPVPESVPETMWHYLRFVDDTVGLAAGSDDLATLHSFLAVYGDLDDHGRPRPVDLVPAA
jgi:hypothetical protein